ncbi:MAG TPA: hypothetical protein VGE39_05500 [Prosthecobacter sp.]
MPQLELDAYPDSTADRRKVAEFLETHWKSAEKGSWEQQMCFWWDDNPAAAVVQERGRWVHAEDRLVGFGGSIPALHAWLGRPLPALYATTLCVDKRFPKAGALIFLKQRQLGEQHIIAHTTPNPRLQEALLKMGALAETRVTRQLLLAGAASHLRGRSWWPAFPADKKLVNNPLDVTSLVRPYQRTDRVEKWITPEYLRWFCFSRMREHHFLGVVDAVGVLSSYVLVTPRRIKGLRAWDVVETFTTNDDLTELHALIGRLVKEPHLLPGGALLLTAATFASDDVWNTVPALMRRSQEVCHYFLMPDSLRNAPKHTVMAEGDLGL